MIWSKLQFVILLSIARHNVDEKRRRCIVDDDDDDATIVLVISLLFGISQQQQQQQSVLFIPNNWIKFYGNIVVVDDV